VRQAISKSERLLALQRLPDLERELVVLAQGARERKEALRQRRAAKGRERAAKLAAGLELDPNETDEYCPDVRDAPPPHPTPRLQPLPHPIALFLVQARGEPPTRPLAVFQNIP